MFGGISDEQVAAVAAAFVRGCAYLGVGMAAAGFFRGFFYWLHR